MNNLISNNNINDILLLLSKIFKLYISFLLFIFIIRLIWNSINKI